MKKTAIILVLITIAFSSRAQTIIIRDPEIKKMVDEISKDNLEQHVRKMVSFHTRHNLSQQNDPVTGIGAAWNWIKTEMEKNIPASQGRLSVGFEEYSVGGEGQRITKETKLKNVVSTLRGTDPTDDRIILIGAHLDSRAALDNDNTGFAPGANDDGSGVATLLELIRIMSTRKFSATIVFMALSGEEMEYYSYAK
jgi:acetylornithine deacetylase/succinyl-diaminopimelate desuccinylase-like protein